jgi:hypothetical protein
MEETCLQEWKINPNFQTKNNQNLEIEICFERKHKKIACPKNNLKVIR